MRHPPTNVVPVRVLQESVSRRAPLSDAVAPVELRLNDAGRGREGRPI
jgi:hypothetical protein